MNWTRDQILAALHLYTQLPFGQLHHRNPRIQALADKMGRTPSSVAMKLTNLASLDPQILTSDARGCPAPRNWIAKSGQSCKTSGTGQHWRLQPHLRR